MVAVRLRVYLHVLRRQLLGLLEAKVDFVGSVMGPRYDAVDTGLVDQGSRSVLWSETQQRGRVVNRRRTPTIRRQPRTTAAADGRAPTSRPVTPTAAPAAATPVTASMSASAALTATASAFHLLPTR